MMPAYRTPLRIAARATLGAALLFASAAAAHSQLPAGTLLPVILDHGLNAAKLHAGQPIRVRLVQSIPGTHVHRGAQVLGRVLQASAPKGGPARLAIRFSAIEDHGRSIPIRASLRALASPLEVLQAQIPEEMSSRGLTPETWTTQQIGGDQVYRGGGPVTEGVARVGTPAPYGVIGQPQPQPGRPCRGRVAASGHPQVLGLFSADACGIYGFPNLRLERAGRAGGGVILFVAAKGKLNLGGGAAMLLRVAP